MSVIFKEAKVRIVTLSFDNRTAENLIEMHVSGSAVPDVMDWYGAFYAGDDYDVFINGRKQTIGVNGEFEPLTIDVEVTGS